MQTENLVSIITPCYNSSAFIEQTIQSVQAQTYTDWEMLIVDDCSKDDSAEIIRRYIEKDQRIKYLKTEYSSGSPVKPRNIAIEKAQGRYIAFLDSDDVWLPNKLEEQLNLFDDKKVAVVYSNYEKVNENGERGNRIIKAPTETNYQNLLKGNVIGNLTGIYDTEKVGKVYSHNIHNEDYILWLSILKRGYKAKNTNSVTALYRVRKNSVSSNKLKGLSSLWYILRDMENLPLHRAMYYFAQYAVKGFLKAIKLIVR